MRLYSNEIIELLQDLDPQQVVLQSATKTFTVSMLLKESQNLAINLRKNGMESNDRIVIATQVGVEFVIIMFAAMMLNCMIAIIDPEMGAENYTQKLKQFDPKWVFLDSRLALLQEHPILRYFYLRSGKNRPYFPRRKKIKTISTGQWMPLLQKHTRLSGLLKNKVKVELEFEKIESMPYLVTYTSGTLSVPKGVLHTTKGLEKSIQLIAELIRSKEPQMMATHLPHFMLIGGCAGIGTKLWDVTWPAAKRYNFILDEDISILFAPPTEYRELIDYCEQENKKLPKNLNHIILGSAPVHQSFLTKLIEYLPSHTKITCFYGMTENLIVATIDGREKAMMSSEGDPLGVPLDGIKVRIAEDGEIHLKSEQLFERYLHLKDRPEWHATGDLGFVDDKGRLILKGRKKDMIIRKNFNLYPALYIPTIKKIPGVIDAVYIGVYNERLADEEVYLFVESNTVMHKDQLMKRLSSGSFSIDKDALPDYIHFRKIPRKGRQQKIDRQKLREELSEFS